MDNKACLLCQQPLVHELTLRELLGWDEVSGFEICARCQQEFQEIAPPHCPTCFKTGSSQKCWDCQYWTQHGYQAFQHIALYQYNAAMHDYFKRYKRYGDYQLRFVFQAQLQRAIGQLPGPYLYIPGSAQHLQLRQFDPVVVLFQNIAALIPALIKLPTTQAQAQKNRAERLATPQFLQFDRQYTALLAQPQLTILDDIYTTGRTLFHARDCLIAAGFQGKIYTFSLAR